MSAFNARHASSGCSPTPSSAVAVNPVLFNTHGCCSLENSSPRLVRLACYCCALRMIMQKVMMLHIVTCRHHGSCSKLHMQYGTEMPTLIRKPTSPTSASCSRRPGAGCWRMSSRGTRSRCDAAMRWPALPPAIHQAACLRHTAVLSQQHTCACHLDACLVIVAQCDQATTQRLGGCWPLHLSACTVADCMHVWTESRGGASGCTHSGRHSRAGRALPPLLGG